MNVIKFVSIPLAVAAISAANAAPAPKLVSLPFSNEAIISKDHSGLVFNYELDANAGKRIVCKVSNVYKSWFEYSSGGQMLESGVFGEYQTVIFTSNNQKRSNDSAAHYQADPAGEIKVNETRSGKPSQATASCFYEKSK